MEEKLGKTQRLTQGALGHIPRLTLGQAPRAVVEKERREAMIADRTEKTTC